MDPKDKQLNQARVEQVLSEINQIWIDNGYIKEYPYHEILFSSPFHMAREVRNDADPEVDEAFRIFQSRLLRTEAGQMYVRDLAKVSTQWCDSVLYENAKDKYWDVYGLGDVNTRLSVISSMSSGRFRNEEYPLSGKFVSALMNNYVYSIKRDGNDEREIDRLENRKFLIFRYFEDYFSRDSEYWTSEEGVRTIYNFTKYAGADVVEYIRGKYDALSLSEEGVNPAVQEQQERFESIWETLELPGLAEGKYEDLRESFIKKLRKPGIVESFRQVFGPGRKNPFVAMLDQIHKCSKDKDSVYQEVSKKFMENLLFDPELFPLVEGLRRIAEEEKGRKIFKKYKLDIKFEDVFEASMANAQFLSSEWYGSEGGLVLDAMYEYSPQLYLLVMERWLQIYCKGEGLSSRQRAVLGGILETRFTVDLKGENRRIYSEAKKDLDRFQGSKVEGFVARVFGREYEEMRLKDNVEFFQSTGPYIAFWKKSKYVGMFGHIFNTNERRFHAIIQGFIHNAPNTKDENYFDNIRIINELGKKMEEEAARGVHMEEDKMGDIRDETERKVLATAYEICSVPEVRISLCGKEGDPETLYSVYREYRKRYTDIVERIPEGEVLPEIFVRDDLKIGLVAPLTDGNRRLITSLGFNIVKEEDGSEYLDVNQNVLLRRMLGILVSPTLHEWREDDKINRNQKNDRVRTLFFVPRDIEIDFRDSSPSGATMFFSKTQRQHFIQNYLQWYIEAKYMSGDISSFNTVVAAWLSDQPDLRMDAEHQKEDIRKKLDGIWDDFTDALGVAYNIERFKRFELLRRLLLATNIEELVPLITSDVTQVAILSSAILRGTLEAAQEAKIFRNIQKVTSTLGQQFEGSLTMAYLSGEKLERIKEGLKKLGFQDTDEGLQMFRNIWRNLFYLRGERGSNQTLRISTEGLSISNPSRTMYPSKVVPSKNKKGETVENVVREYEGGRDKLVVSWAQIRQIGEVDYDYTFLVDFSVKLLTSLASIGGKDKRPEVIDVLEEEGPANIVVRLPGREQPLFEIFAVKRPKEVWKLIIGMAELMADEEGPATLKDLLSVLEKD